MFRSESHLPYNFHNVSSVISGTCQIPLVSSHPDEVHLVRFRQAFGRIPKCQLSCLDLFKLAQRINPPAVFFSIQDFEVLANLHRFASPRAPAADSHGIQDFQVSTHVPRLALPRAPADRHGIQNFEVSAHLLRLAYASAPAVDNPGIQDIEVSANPLSLVVSGLA